MAWGPNKVSLIEAQRNFALLGASEPRRAARVRSPSSVDVKDPEWHQFNEQSDLLEEPITGTEYGNTYPKDGTTLYYWRPNFWLRNS
jgi:Cysteine-rich CPCC